MRIDKVTVQLRDKRRPLVFDHPLRVTRDDTAVVVVTKTPSGRGEKIDVFPLDTVERVTQVGRRS